jgi:hypothetical protein
MELGEEKFDRDLLQTLKQKYQMFFSSEVGEIKVFLIPAYPDPGETTSSAKVVVE